MRPRLLVGPEAVFVATLGPETVNVQGADIPIARIWREQNRHHPKCPTYPGKPLAPDTICADCIYGHLAERPQP